MLSLRRKKRFLIHNGSASVTIKTRHGAFAWARLHFRANGGEEVRLFEPSVSEPLRLLALDWVHRLSFGDLSRLTELVSGQDLLSEDSIWRLAQAEAARLDSIQAQQIQEPACLPEPAYNAPVRESLYDSDAPEFVTMTDGIGVKSVTGM